MDPVTARGWSNIGGSEWGKQFSPRQGCHWTDKEDYDLIQQVKWGVPVEWIADFHQRSLGGISSRLAYPERAEAGAARYEAGIPKPVTKRSYTYNSRRGLKRRLWEQRKNREQQECSHHHRR